MLCLLGWDELKERQEFTQLPFHARAVLLELILVGYGN